MTNWAKQTIGSESNKIVIYTPKNANQIQYNYIALFDAMKGNKKACSHCEIELLVL